MDKQQSFSIQGGTDTDKIEVLGNWVRFNAFNAGTSSIETFDANGKNVHGNGTANTLDFSALSSVVDSPLTGGGLRINAEGGDDPVTGTKFDDVINGEAGNDILIGGLGNDSLTGGSGSDKFRFQEKLSGNDTVFDFQDGFDMLSFDISETGVDAFSDVSLTGGSGNPVVVSWNTSTSGVLGTGSVTLNNITNTTLITAADFEFIVHRLIPISRSSSIGSGDHTHL